MLTLDLSTCPVEIRGTRKLHWNKPRRNLVANLRRTLQYARDERPLQEFFLKQPEAIVFGIYGGPHQVWVFPHPQFGTIEGLDSVPDFLICNWSSVGPEWIVVELESPTLNPINTKGISAICNHAVQQVNDYRKFFSEYVESLRNVGWIGLNGDCRGYVVIGRRWSRGSKKDVERLANFRKDKIEIVSYDRVLEKCSEMQRWVNTNSRSARAVAMKRLIAAAKNRSSTKSPPASV